MIILNVMRHVFIDKVAHDIIMTYQKIYLGLLPIGTSNIVSTTPSIKRLNDDNVHILFGWEIMKLKRKYNEINNVLVHYDIAVGKLEILDDTRAYLQDVLHSQLYTRMHYPEDDVIYNKGYLELIPPPYVHELSCILKTATLSINKQNSIEESVIPSKCGVFNKIVAELDNNETNNSIDNICNASTKHVKNTNLNDSMQASLIWELIIRILNAK